MNNFETSYTEMKVPFEGKQFFVTCYEDSYDRFNAKVNAKVFTTYKEAMDARKFAGHTDSFVYAFDTREEAEKFIEKREIEK